VRIPTFSRHTETDTDTARPTTTSSTVASPATTPVRPRQDSDTTTDLPPAPKATGRTTPPPPPAVTSHRSATPVVDEAVVAGPKPRASLLATLGLILGVASVLLVLSGPLLGYGIGVAGLALVLSLAGIRATGKRHVAGKSDALLGMVFALGAIVLGVLALTGSLGWLGTDVPSVNNVREWLDARFVNRF
jgi:hypothetical protein